MKYIYYNTIILYVLLINKKYMRETPLCNVILPTLKQCGSICNFNLEDLQKKMYDFGYDYGYKDGLHDNKNNTVSPWNTILLPIIVSGAAGLVAGLILREVCRKLQPAQYFNFFNSETPEEKVNKKACQSI